jgi:light-regulated signal transduction histidine kinase (bacteriophytochrome)
MKKLKVGMIGAGIMGKAHSIAIASMPMFFWPAPAIPERYILADATPELAKGNAERYGYEKSTGDWKEIIADNSVDVVHIVTPNDSHAEVAIAAAKAGKHILCEKPIARTTAEARDMLTAAKEAGIVHQLAFNYRRTPAVAQAKKYIEIQQIRYAGAFRINWDISSEIYGYKTVKLILQPLLENAITHGLLCRIDNEPAINISAGIDKDKKELLFRVADNGCGMSAALLEEVKERFASEEIVENTHIGLQNLNQRIKLIFGDEYGIKIESAENRGTTVYVILPAIKK